MYFSRQRTYCNIKKCMLFIILSGVPLLFCAWSPSPLSSFESTHLSPRIFHKTPYIITLTIQYDYKWWFEGPGCCWSASRGMLNSEMLDDRPYCPVHDGTRHHLLYKSEGICATHRNLSKMLIDKKTAENDAPEMSEPVSVQCAKKRQKNRGFRCWSSGCHNEDFCCDFPTDLTPVPSGNVP